MAERSGVDPPVTTRYRPLPLSAELLRQLKRRRTVGVFAVLTALPLILVVAFTIGGDEPQPGPQSFVDLGQASGANLTVFALFASTGFLLIVVVALFAGDTVPAEASWSSLRYLLAAPVPRERLVRQKLVVAGISSTVALVFLPGWTLLVGGVAYGFGPYIGPTGEQIGWPAFAVRLGIIVGYLMVSLLVVAAFAFALGVWTDAPLGAVGGAVLLMIVCTILDSITALGDVRQGLPGPLRVRLGGCAGADHRLVRHGAGRALVDRLRGPPDRRGGLALPAQGHHELGTSRARDITS